jgi:hypothetical protein
MPGVQPQHKEGNMDVARTTIFSQREEAIAMPVRKEHRR